MPLEHHYKEIEELEAHEACQDCSAPKAPPTSLPEMTAVYALQAPAVPKGAVISLEMEGSDYVYYGGLYYPWDDFI